MDPEFEESAFPTPFPNACSVPPSQNQEESEPIDFEFDELDGQFETASVASSAFSFLPHAPRPETITLPLREKRPRVDARKIKSQIKDCLQKVKNNPFSDIYSSIMDNLLTGVPPYSS